MLCVTLLALFCCGITINAGPVQQRSSSFSGEYGGSDGQRFTHTGNQLYGPITAIRLRSTRTWITGIQICYGTKWSDYVGGKRGEMEEVYLHPGESIIQVEGKSGSYVRKLVFITDKGRRFSFGTEHATPFNAAPLYPGSVLRYISGKADEYLNAISFHWDSYPTHCSSCGK